MTSICWIKENTNYGRKGQWGQCPVGLLLARGPELWPDTWKQATADDKFTLIHKQTFECVHDPRAVLGQCNWYYHDQPVFHYSIVQQA